MKRGHEAKRNPEMRQSFGSFLKYLMQSGVRSPGTDRRGEPWKSSELAEVLEVSTRMIGAYLSSDSLPDTERFRTLERALFGSGRQAKTAQHEELVRLYTSERRAKRGIPDFGVFGLSSTVELVWEQIESEIALPKNIAMLDASSVDDLGWTIRQIDPGMHPQQSLALAERARAHAFTTKYGSIPPEKDERFLYGIDIWRNEFRYLLEKLSIPWSARVLSVGIGCGFEGEGVYDRFESFFGVDISLTSVSRARSVFNKFRDQIFQNSAEDLRADFHNFDLYLSLKTYSSSFFDINRATEQMSRVVRPGGVAIISVPRGYLNEDRSLTPGLARTTYNLSSARQGGTYKIADRGYPLELLGEITSNLYRRHFFDVGYFTGATEHYVYARKH